MIGRRSFITGLISLVAAPAIVRAGSLMPVKVMIEPYGIGPMMAALENWDIYHFEWLSVSEVAARYGVGQAVDHGGIIYRAIR